MLTGSYQVDAYSLFQNLQRKYIKRKNSEWTRKYYYHHKAHFLAAIFITWCWSFNHHLKKKNETGWLEVGLQFVLEFKTLEFFFLACIKNGHRCSCWCFIALIGPVGGNVTLCVWECAVIMQLFGQRHAAVVPLPGMFSGVRESLLYNLSATEHVANPSFFS